jgi:hypothetical protein
MTKTSKRNYQREYAKNNRDIFRRSSKKWALHNRNKVLLNCSKQNARKKKQEHSISLEDIKIPDICPVFGTKFDTGMHVASIDRVDNSKGYIPGNIQIISKRANMMKYDASIPELIQFAQWVLRTYGKES